MGKRTICIYKNKVADQLRGNCEADQRLCFRYTDSTLPLLFKIRNFKLPACFCDCTARFVSHLFGNHIVGFPTRRLSYDRFWQDDAFEYVCSSLLTNPQNRAKVTVPVPEY